MSSQRHVHEQLRNLKEGTRHWNEGTSQKLQTLSFLTLLWPLLPELPAEPPRAAVELLKQSMIDQCDICGGPAPPFQQHKVMGSHKDPGTSVQKVDPSVESPLSQMMAEIERKMDATLTSIETTTQKTEELSRDVQKLEITGQSNMTDTELVTTLKTLMKEKSSREDRVKVLESKEQQLKDSLNTAINWAKKVDGKNFIK